MNTNEHKYVEVKKVLVEGVRFGYGQRVVVDDVSFSLKAGELVAVVGPNGCGKSTLLKLLIGALVPLAGKIALDDKRIGELGRIGVARRMAMVPQMAGEAGAGGGGFAMGGGGGFTVQQTVLMSRYAAHVEEGGGLLKAAGGLGIFGFETSADQQLATEAMWSADVHHLVDREVDTLSGGERQRVAIARALAQQTPILMLDEPTSALDLYHQLELIEQMRMLVGQGRMVVLVTHDLNLAAACASRVMVMDQGRIAADGTPAQVLTPEVLEPVYHVKVRREGGVGGGMLRFERRNQK